MSERRRRPHAMSDPRIVWKARAGELVQEFRITFELDPGGAEGRRRRLLRQLLEENGLRALRLSGLGVCRECKGLGWVPDPERSYRDLVAARWCPACRGSGVPD